MSNNQAGKRPKKIKKKRNNPEEVKKQTAEIILWPNRGSQVKWDRGTERPSLRIKQQAYPNMRSLLMRDFTINQRDVFTIILFNLFSCRLVSLASARLGSPDPRIPGSAPLVSVLHIRSAETIARVPLFFCVDCYYRHLCEWLRAETETGAATQNGNDYLCW